MDKLKNPSAWIGFLIVALGAVQQSGLVVEGGTAYKVLALSIVIMGAAGSWFFGAGLRGAAAAVVPPAAVLLLALGASGCAGYTAQQGVACASATLTALANGSEAVLECRKAAKTGTDEQIQQCIEEALISVSKATAAIPACLPPAK